jgi:tryptophan synthase alpha subunit
MPDMAVEELAAYSAIASKLCLSTIFAVSPNRSETRLRNIVASTSGFLYTVSVYGITDA